MSIHRLDTFAKAVDVDLAVPPLAPGRPSSVTLKQVAAGYSQWVTPNWERACNVEYRSGSSGPSVSLIAENGVTYIPALDRRWPVMLATRDGKADIRDGATVTDVGIKSSRWAFSAGPWLIRGGQPCDISAEVALGGFSGLMETSLRERAGIGILRDGTIAHTADTAATLAQVRDVLLSLGCVDAIGLDGGGSLGVIDAEGNILLGYSTRQVCSALIFKRLTDYVGDTQPGGEKQVIVCIDPGHGGPDPGATNIIEGLREKDIVLNVSMRVAEYLRRKGVKVVLTREKDTDLALGLDDEAELKARGEVSNVAKADYFISVHVDSFSDETANGSTVHYWPNSLRGKPLAESIADNLLIASGLASRGIKATSFAVLRHADAPAVLVELGFMSNKADRWVMREPAWQDRVALGIAYGILQAAG